VGLENWNSEFRSCKRIVVEERESREWEYNGVQRRTTESMRMKIESVVGRRKLVVEEKLEVGL
jgi:hypothetical protein